MKKMNFLDWLTFILLVIGGINWGLIGFFGFDLVGTIFGQMSLVSRILYALVGLSAVYVAFLPSMMMSDESTYISTGKPAMKSM